MKATLFAFFCFFLPLLNAQNEQDSSTKIDANIAKGIWLIDLRPTPDSEPYLQELKISPNSGTAFSGVFYNTNFTNGYFNQNWEELHFAFTTADNSSTYFTSGTIKGDEIKGVTYSPERGFTMPWTGYKMED